MRVPRPRPYALAALGVASALALGAASTSAVRSAGAEHDDATGRLSLSPAPGSAGVRYSGGDLRLDAASGRDVRTRRPGDVRLGDRTGVALLRPAHVPAGTGAVTLTTRSARPADVTASVRVETPHGWSEWTAAARGHSVALPAPGTTVQVRLLLTAGTGEPGPEVDRVTLTPDPGTRVTAKDRPEHPVRAHVYATREGLVGGTTANGHEIVEDDHFVALPSPRAVSAKGSGEYSVRVCTDDPDHRRCAWAPVWDVGPWNSDDDYWNPADVRERFTDLPQGRPEAQAAYEDGYHNGKDGYGREVSNPAGIDLADGTFRGDLALDDNGWVDVTYLWSGGPATATVVARKGSGGSIAVRDEPSRDGDVVGGAADHAGVVPHCAADGAAVEGPEGTSGTWFRIADGMYLPSVNVTGAGDVPDC